jgi:hypothetical protein
MAIPPNSMLDWNLLAGKPDDVDRVNPVYDIDANEQKCQTYAVLKSFFVKTDEASDIEHTVRFKSKGVTYPNSYLKFGSAGEFQEYSDGTDMFIEGTTATGKLRFYAGSGPSEMLTLDPAASSIATRGMAINKDGTTSEGVYFDAQNDMVLYNRILCTGAGIATSAQNINFTGVVNRGLEFDSNQYAYFKDKVIINDTSTYALDVYGKSLFRKDIVTNTGIKIVLGGNIQTGSKFISSDGSDNAGIKLTTTQFLVYEKLRMVGATSKNIEMNTGVISYDGFTQGMYFNAANNAYFNKTIYGLQGIDVASYCDAATGFRVAGVAGISATINPSTTTSMTIVGGIITAYS